MTHIIDGDTFIASNGRTMRLLNINSPEKGVSGYEEAKTFMNSYINLTLEAEVVDNDKYGRALVKLYSPEYLNLKMVKEGVVSKFLVSEEEKEIFAESEENAIKKEKGLWKKSPHSNGCIIISINKKEEVISLKNSCQSISTENWWLKDESRKIYRFTNTFKIVYLHSGKGQNNETDIYWGSSTPIWNDDRDTLYLFDEENLLVSHKSYGY